MIKRFIDLYITIVFLTRKLSLSIGMLVCFASPSLGQIKKVEIVDNPIINDNRVTVRIKVKGAEERPVMGLENTDFQLKVDGKEKEFFSQDWKSQEESIPPPARIVMLLDFSGSMEKSDIKGTKKIEGAIEAIRKLINVLEERGGDTKIAIVPFGKPGMNCKGNPVNQETLDKFFSASDFKLINHLDYLASLTPCASTNLYEPLKRTVKFLANTRNTDLYPEKNSTQPQPRLSIILLSDGYHNFANEEQDFQKLITFLKKNNNIVVHTLGYGLTPEQLGQKYRLGKPATRADINTGKIPEAEFVDKQRLAQIAKATGGIAEFSGDAQAVAQNLLLFLNSLLGEYEITYTQLNPERGSKHKVKVLVTSKQSSVESSAKEYMISVFGRSLPLSVRLSMIATIFLLLTLGGVIPFYFWGEHLKKQALRD